MQACTRAQLSTRVQADTRCKWYCILIPLHSWMDGWEDRGWLVCYNSKEGPLMHLCLLSPAFTPVPTHAPVCTQTLVSAHAHLQSSMPTCNLQCPLAIFNAHLQYCIHLHHCICSSPCACSHPCIHLCLLVPTCTCLQPCAFWCPCIHSCPCTHSYSLLATGETFAT